MVFWVIFNLSVKTTSGIYDSVFILGMGVWWWWGGGRRGGGHIQTFMFYFMHTPGLLGWIKRSDGGILQISIF